MGAGDILRLFLIIVGIYILLKAVLSLAKRKMTEVFCLVWAVLSSLMIVSGFLLNPTQLDHMVSIRGLLLCMIAISGILWGLWYISTEVSLLKRKNQELAMQISLLNFEYEKISEKLEKAGAGK